MGKSIFLSKTFWVNTILLALYVINYCLNLAGYQHLEVSENTMVVILSVVNIILRLITNKPISW